MRSFCLALLLCFSVFSGWAQIKQPSAAAPISYANEAVVVEQLETSLRYNSDGTGEEDMHERIQAQNEAGLRQLSVIAIPYASATQTAQIQSLRVDHSDGTSTETPTSDAMDLPAPVTQAAPLYSDIKVLQIPVRGLRTGDTLDYRARITMKKAEAPSQFWNTFSFVKSAVVLAQTLKLDVPAGKYVQVWSPTVKPTITVSGDRRVYLWLGNQLKPTSLGNKKDGDSAKPAADTKPSVAWTTFHSWKEVGGWYHALAAPQAVPTDALRAKADEITAQAKTPEEQVQALYSYVSTHIRYVGVDFGIGRAEPHAAAEVLANQYGDCKDKDTLLEALLHAKGFTTAPALIGVNIDMIPELPSPGLFNHVITTVTLPSGQVWMDSTPGITPFRLLVAPLRDKQALVIPSSGTAALERTPAQLPFPFVDRLEATGTLKADGDLTGHIDIHDRSDSEIVVRALARNIAPAQWDKGSQYLSSFLGFGGTTSNTTFASAEDLSVPMHVSYDYARKPYGDWPNFRIVPLFPSIFLPVAPEKQPSAEIDLGAVRTEVAISRIHLPENFGANLPDAVHVKTPFATFDKTYQLEGGELTAKRTIVILQSKLPAASWQQYKKFAGDISLGQMTWVQLTSTGAAGAAEKGPQPPKAGETNPAAAQLIADATVLEKSGDWTGTLKKLDEAKSIKPTQPFLWSNYGFVAMKQDKPKEAEKDFRHEFDLHPKESYVVWLYTRFLHQQGEDEKVRSVLTSSFNNDPSDVRDAMLLAWFQAKSSLPDAIATLRRANAAAPDSSAIQLALAGYLIRNLQPGEAATIAKKQLEGAEDPDTLNNAAYLLAQTKSDLPLAEQKTRKALAILDSDTSTASIGEANAHSFQQTSLLTATWDTLGYILMQENQLDEAQDYIEAAWNNLSSEDVGAHYGELLEKMGKPKEALRIYELARKPQPTGTTPFESQQIEAGIALLKKAGTVSPANFNATQILQGERSFKVTLKSARKQYGSAIFRLQFAAASTVAVMRVSGDTSLDDATDSIQQLRLPHLVPSHSTARILRDAVLSCSVGKRSCDFVLMPLGGIKAEGTGN